jgi:protein arginine kinase
VTLDLSLLPDGGLHWLTGGGEHAGIVLSSRIRLARNLSGFAFPPRAREGERLRVLHQVRGILPQVEALRDAAFVRVDECSLLERQLLHERHLVSRELAGLERAGEAPTGAAVVVAGEAGVMVNEEDHLRLQVFRSGFDIPGALLHAEQLDRSLAAHLPYAWHQEFGFLTACPTNTGTGLRASVLMHLPALVLTQEIGKVLQGLQHMGLTYRGLYGEGSDVLGNLFQISNQTTLGRSEDDLADQLVRVVERVIEREEEARGVLSRDAGYIIEDKVWRAYGTLRHARSLPAEEAMSLLSGLRLAAGMDLIRGISVYTLNKLLIFSQSAHLAHTAGRMLTESEANVARARYVRQTLVNEVRDAG